MSMHGLRFHTMTDTDRDMKELHLQPVSSHALRHTMMLQPNRLL